MITPEGKILQRSQNHESAYATLRVPNLVLLYKRAYHFLTRRIEGRSIQRLCQDLRSRHVRHERHQRISLDSLRYHDMSRLEATGNRHSRIIGGYLLFFKNHPQFESHFLHTRHLHSPAEAIGPSFAFAHLRLHFSKISHHLLP